MAQHLQRQSIRSPPPSDEKGVALFPLRRFSDDERRREEYFAGVERGVAHALRERGERGFGDAVARLAYRRELSGTPSNTSVETPQNSSMRPPPRYIRRTRFVRSFAIIVVMSFAKEYSKTTEKRRNYLDNFNSHTKELEPAKAHFQGVYVSILPQRSWQHFQQLGDLLRVAGGEGSDATAEAVDGRAEAVQVDVADLAPRNA